MDPALHRSIRQLPGHAEIEALALLRPDHEPPPGMRIVTCFRDVVSCRVRAGDVPAVRAHPAVRSLKAARAVTATHAWAEDVPVLEGAVAERRPKGAPTGEGVVVAALDWGCDFAHPSFRRADGSTRLRALWDQRGPAVGEARRYGYGRIFLRDRIDAALRARDPYADLGYHPSATRPLGGAHGTHVLDIAAGSGRAPGCAPGVAPGADLVFVHLATKRAPHLEDLGDSVRIVEALDFVLRHAAPRPVSINMSLGLTGGSHSGQSLVEQAMDALLEDRPGCAISNSAGNYLRRRLHAEGVVLPAQTVSLGWEIDEGDPTTNELEIWYSGRDRLGLELIGPLGTPRLSVPLGGRHPIEMGGRAVGYAYHREDDPLTRDHHVDLFLEPGAPGGTWLVRLTGDDVSDGRYHAWIERDSTTPRTQSRFDPDVASSSSTVGTIATGYRSLIVGACDSRTGEPAPFSSAGPTRDGRRKPDLVAPGVGILAARSTPVGALAGTGGALRMSGTSMAAPLVTGAVALLFAAAGRKLNIAETRLLVLGTARHGGGDPMRTGAGTLDVDAALRAVARMSGAAAAGARPSRDRADAAGRWEVLG